MCTRRRVRGGTGGSGSVRVPLIARIGREYDPVTDQGAQETAITEHEILSRTAEGEKTRVQDFTGPHANGEHTAHDERHPDDLHRSDQR